MRFILAIIFVLATLPASAQVRQSGNVTPTHAACWTTNGVVQDCGTAAVPYLTTLGINGQLCVNSGVISGSYNALCLLPTSSGGGFTWTSYGGATGIPTFNINGTIYPFPFSTTGIVGPPTTVSGDAACWNNIAGTLLKDCGGPLSLAGSLTTSGAYNSTFTMTGSTSVTFPTSGTLLAGNQTITLSGDVTGSGATAITTTVAKIAGVSVGTPTGTGNVVFSSSPSLSSPTISGGALSGTFTGTPTLSGSNFISLANIVQAGAYTLDGNATGSTANRTDFTIGSLTAKTVPTTSDLVVISDQAASGALKQATLGTLPGVGTYVLLATLTASNSASLTDVGNCNTGGSTGCFTSSYSSYEIVFENLIAATTTSQQGQLTVYSGGSFQSTGYLGTATGSASSTSLFNPTTFIPLSLNSTTIESPGLSGEIRVFAPSGTAAPKMWLGNTVYYLGTYTTVTTVGGFWNGNGAVNGFQFAWASGNITSGIIKIYGIQ